MKRINQILPVVLLLLTLVLVADAQPSYYLRSYYVYLGVGNHYPAPTFEKRLLSLHTTPDGGLMLRGGTEADWFYHEYYHPFFTKFDENYNLEWTRSHYTEGEQYDMDMLANGYMLWSYCTQWFTSYYENYRPLVELLDEYGNPRKAGVFPGSTDEPQAITSAVFLPGTESLVLCHWEEAGGGNVSLRRYTQDGVLEWESTISGRESSKLYVSPTGELLYREVSTIYVLNPANGAVLSEHDFQTSDGIYIRKMKFQDDGTLYAQATNNTVSRILPPYLEVDASVQIGFTVNDIAPASDGGFAVCTASSFEKYDNQLTQEWSLPFPAGINPMELVVETNPGKYACARWLDDNTWYPVQLIFINEDGSPEPDRTSLDLVLYQDWDEEWNVGPNGGTMDFTASVTNTWDVPLTVDRWVTVVLPRRGVLNYPPVPYTIDPTSWYDQTEESVLIPANAPPGPYAYIVNLGTYPNDIITQSSIVIRKLPDNMATSEPFLNDMWAADPEIASAATIEEPYGDKTLPTEYALSAPYPNPFNAMATVILSLPEAEMVRVALYDVLGREVRVLVDQTLSAGSHRLAIEADNLASGVYLLTAHSQSRRSVTRKLVLLQ
ncbi:T9SS type A sorting domain-containing protein [bacterium]|nr:T9SS type A sorting domain-containing protein [bacterium]